ncbi:MAG TPA: transcriptional regulator [Micromonosporaceae bacterium]|jgi:DNA-binding transcriptional ArsR family regulator
MGIWQIGVDELANSRFTVSPLTETLAALIALCHSPALPGMHDWARAHRPRYRRHVADDPFPAALVDAALRPRSIADFIAVPPRRTDRTFGDELRGVRSTPAAVAQRDLALGGTLAPSLAVPDVAERTADLLEWVWTNTVRPDWPRRRRIFEADIIARTQRLGAGGWAAALDGMRPGMRWLGDGRLQINTLDNPPRKITEAELMFIPATARGWVSWDLPHRYAVVYPCAGLMAEPATAPPPDALARLVGPVRATVLVHLAEPASTSHLVAVTGYSLGSVGGHLKVLLDAGLVGRRRAGRSVLYFRTALGERLVRP